MSDIRTFQVQHLVGRPVTALNGKRIGRLEELHVEAKSDRYEVTEFLLGTGALIDRLGIGDLIGRQTRELVARWDQIVFDDDGTMKLACPVSDLEERER
jgi:sporulation protein YlmC with PRC-barrel domain